MSEDQSKKYKIFLSYKSCQHKLIHVSNIPFFFSFFFIYRTLDMKSKSFPNVFQKQYNQSFPNAETLWDFVPAKDIFHKDLFSDLGK